MKKFLNWLPLAFTPFVLASCNNSNEKIIKYQQKIQEPETTNQADFNLFAKTNVIQTILNIIYPDKTEQQKYVNEQINLDQNYKNQVQVALRYANNITGSLRSFYSFGGPVATIKASNDILDNLVKKNWLFFLFNLSNITFMQDPEFTRDKTASELDSENAENALLYNQFYRPKSNQIIDYVVQEYSNDEWENEKVIYMLTKEGYILQLNIIIPKQEDSQLSVNLSMYLYTYPKLLLSLNKTEIFDLKKFILDTKSFSDFDLYGSNTNNVLFTDKYGGAVLRYTAVDIK
ncbi:aromatic motif membrane protein [Mycoplasmopsis gallopavonis]|uniref:Lipoprotein n=1 Tax=Mycoplasmopsis gallopavonis TaxID=76629 RepID=A0A449B070_9BACT|nr:aromatic motif membrane protein [Mycoplasmopsis gallopavonis]RIV16381.1 hypothetical protein D1113_02570 [Mycoplasmopsis gallopavonis]VEU73116.1 Uncharacterised protein [Mycoplasmopsis gallopavonis]